MPDEVTAAERVVAYARRTATDIKGSGNLVRLACKRFLADLESDQWQFDEEFLENVLAFCRMCRHYKAEWVGQVFEPEDWQLFILANMFCFIAEDGYRRIRTAYIEVPRKNGKTFLAAVISLMLLTIDGEAGAEVYCAATKKDQAMLLFRDVVKVVRASPELGEILDIYKSVMHLSATSSKIEALGSNADSLDGLNVHGAVIDEFHAHKTREVWDVLETGTGSRRQPLMVAITTAGFNIECVCHEYREYAERILDPKSKITDDTLFAFIACPDKGDDWRKEQTWRKANPNYGVSVIPDDIRRLAKKAEEMPTETNNFLCKRLNIWVTQEERWLPMPQWDECDAKPHPIGERTSEAGFDGSTNRDVSALVYVSEDADGVFDVWPFFWLPRENAIERERRDRVPYLAWAEQGFITLTEGDTVDWSFIRQTIIDQAETLRMNELRYDPHNARQFCESLAIDDGIPTIEFKQSVTNYNEPSMRLIDLIMAGKLRHGGHPVLRWMANNVVAYKNPQNLVMPSKGRSREKIDGICAMIMALAGAMFGEGEQLTGYETDTPIAFDL